MSAIRSTRPSPSHWRRDPVPLELRPKPGGGTRAIAHLELDDFRRYAAAVAHVVPAVESALGPSVYSDRACVCGEDVILADWRRARTRFRAVLSGHLRSEPRGAVFVGDVHDCFGSITADVVERALLRCGAPAEQTGRVIAVLRDLQSRGVTGLPVGPAASAPLANAVLASVDRALCRDGLKVLRWVDDVVAIGDSVPEVLRAHDAFDRALARVGLRAHPAKTEILIDRGSAAIRLLGDRGSSSATGQRAMLRAP